MKKVVLAGIFVFGSSLLEVHAMNRLTRFANKVVFGRSLMNVHEVNGTYRGTSGGNGKFSSLVQSVQTEDNEELSVQFSHGTELAKKGNQSLVKLNFFDNSKAKFRAQLEESAQSVASEFRRLNALPELDEEERENQKFQAVINEFGVLDDFCKGEFNLNREKANEAFLHALVSSTKDIMQKEISQKEAEIIRLQGRLDELLKDAPQTAESLKIYDRLIRRAEKNVSDAKEKTEKFEVPELVKEEQINDTFKGFSEKLKDIQDEVQRGKDDLEKALKKVFKKIQKQYEGSTSTLLGILEDKCDYMLTSEKKRYEDKKKNLEEKYDHLIELMRDELNQFTALNAQLEKEKELLSLINGVYRSNPDNAFIRSHSFISGNAQEIKGIGDLTTRRARVEGIYNKVRLFSELLGREDLGVEAKPSDLEAVKSWLDRTARGSIFGRYGVVTNLSGNKIRGYYNEEGRDCPGYREHIVEGKWFSGRLNGTIGQLQQFIGANGGPALNRLHHISGSTNAVNNSVRVVWNHPSFYGHNTNQLLYLLNGHQLGRFFHEYGGEFWKDTEGFLGDFHGRCWVPWESGDARDVWNSQFVTRFNAEVDNIQNSIISRAVLLFDFETNPNSPLQRLYEERNQTNPSVINFPSAEIDALVKQCNDFVKKTI